jgi:hypothetical protein
VEMVAATMAGESGVARTEEARAETRLAEAA